MDANEDHDVAIYIPHSLKGLVDLIGKHQSGSDSNFLIMPNSKIELMFFLEGSELDHFYLDSEKSRLLPDYSKNFAILFSSQTRPVATKFRRINAITAVMNPIAAMALFGIPASELKDIHVEPFMIDSPGFIQDTLNALPTFKQQASFIERFLFERLCKSSHQRRAVEMTKSISTLFASEDSLFYETQMDFGNSVYSDSHFNRICKTWLGVTNNEYLMHKKFRSAMYAIHQGGSPLTEIAYNFGFFDQAHFSKTFKRFSGMSPREYRNAVKGPIPELVLL
jgi:hypothetical protein